MDFVIASVLVGNDAMYLDQLIQYGVADRDLEPCILCYCYHFLSRSYLRSPPPVGMFHVMIIPCV